MTESTSTKTKQRKLAWQFEDLAWKIQLPKRQMAAKLLLCFLAKQANNSGSSYAGYKYNMLHTNIRSETTFSNALKYLEGLGLLSWKSLGGGHEWVFDGLDCGHKTRLSRTCTTAPKCCISRIARGMGQLSRNKHQCGSVTEEGTC
jgi:hypothetical protein